MKIGRSDENDIAIKLPFISGTHFILKNEAGSVRIEDNDSTNGLYLNGKRVSIAKVKSGDTISILSVRIRLHNGELFFDNVGDKIHIKKMDSISDDTQITHAYPQI